MLDGMNPAIKILDRYDFGTDTGNNSLHVIILLSVHGLIRPSV